MIRFVFIAFYHLSPNYFKANRTWATEKKISLNSLNKIIYLLFVISNDQIISYLFNIFLCTREKMNKLPFYKWHLIFLFSFRVMRTYHSNEGLLEMSPLPVMTFFCLSFMVIDDKMYKRILYFALFIPLSLSISSSFSLFRVLKGKTIIRNFKYLLSIFKN